MVESARIVCDGLEANGHHPTLINARFIKPYDAALLDRLKADHELLITIEEAAPRGGLRDTVLQHFQNAGNTPRIHSFSLPDDFVPHGSREELMKEVHLDAAYLLESILDLIK